jgi:hypothetical protein
MQIRLTSRRLPTVEDSATPSPSREMATTSYNARPTFGLTCMGSIRPSSPPRLGEVWPSCLIFGRALSWSRRWTTSPSWPPSLNRRFSRPSKLESGLRFGLGWPFGEILPDLLECPQDRSDGAIRVLRGIHRPYPAQLWDYYSDPQGAGGLGHLPVPFDHGY